MVCRLASPCGRGLSKNDVSYTTTMLATPAGGSDVEKGVASLYFRLAVKLRVVAVVDVIAATALCPADCLTAARRTPVRLMHLLGNGTSSSSEAARWSSTTTSTEQEKSWKSLREATPRCFPPYVTCRTWNVAPEIIVHPSIGVVASVEVLRSFDLAPHKSANVLAHQQESAIWLLMTPAPHGLSERHNVFHGDSST